MKSQNEINFLMTALDEIYPDDDVCFLNHGDAWQLLVATILSAQCTDARVNLVTPGLFAKYPDAAAFAAADLPELETAIKSTGFYHTKAAHIIAAAQKILLIYNGQVPVEMERLLDLPGVGRKTANLLRGQVFGIPSVIVDTHVKRISKKWGLTEHTDPDKIEMDLRAILPEEHWTRYNTQVIAHGRAVCLARNPRCASCTLKTFCEWVS